MALSDEAIDAACQRLEDFLLVSRARDPRERLDAIEMFSLALGLPGPQRERLASRLTKYVPQDGMAIAWAMMGVLVGLAAAETETGAFFGPDSG